MPITNPNTALFIVRTLFPFTAGYKQTARCWVKTGRRKETSKALLIKRKQRSCRTSPTCQTVIEKHSNSLLYTLHETPSNLLLIHLLLHPLSPHTPLFTHTHVYTHHRMADLSGYDEEQVAMMEERVILLNEQDEVVGHASKKECTFCLCLNVCALPSSLSPEPLNLFNQPLLYPFHQQPTLCAPHTTHTQHTSQVSACVSGCRHNNPTNTDNPATRPSCLSGTPSVLSTILFKHCFVLCTTCYHPVC